MRSYPATRQGTDVDDYHGESVPDPYRWLENTDDPETVAWIGAQNEVTESFLVTVPGREEIRARLTRLWDYPKFSVPFERGGRWFQSRNSGLQAQPVLYVLAAPDAAGQPLLDPNSLSEEGTTAVSSTDVSPDGSLLAYATSDKGSDWQTWHVRDVATGADRADLIEWAKFSGAAWRKDGTGFFYSAMQPAAPGAEYLESSGQMRIFFHEIGTRQAEDKLVFAAPDEPDWLPYAEVSDDGRFLIIAIEMGSVFENQVHVLDLTDPAAQLQPLIGDFESVNVPVTTVGTTFYLITDHAAERKRLVAVDLDRLGREHWREVIPEGAETLLEVHFYGGSFVCHYLRDAHSVVRVHAMDGTHVRDIPVTGIASLGGDAVRHNGIEGRPDSPLLHFLITSFTESGALWSHDLATGQTTLVRPSAAGIDPAAYVTEQVLAPSADGTRIPMFLTRRRDVTADASAPALLYGYGGFDISITPSFSEVWAGWLERGGILAVANLRGGGEFGRAWHDGGRRALKQHVFDDFCGCAQWLADSGWSRPDRIAASGGSNGGLLVGACLTQQPELFGACVPEVGVFDMLRYPKFTIGWAWTGELGNPDDPTEYSWLRGYSPLHNLRDGTAYPATLLLTGDHDDRVVPGHSFKFAATMQRAQAGDAPVLIRIDTAAGHGGGKPTGKAIAAGTDVLAFLEAVIGPARDSGTAPG